MYLKSVIRSNSNLLVCSKLCADHQFNWMYQPMCTSTKKLQLRKVLVIGGGIAGCAVASGLKAVGLEAVILDAATQSGAGASGNPAGLVVPFLSVGDMIGARLSISCLADTRAFLDEHVFFLNNLIFV